MEVAPETGASHSGAVPQPPCRTTVQKPSKADRGTCRWVLATAYHAVAERAEEEAAATAARAAAQVGRLALTAVYEAVADRSFNATPNAVAAARAQRRAVCRHILAGVYSSAMQWAEVAAPRVVLAAMEEDSARRDKLDEIRQRPCS